MSPINTIIHWINNDNDLIKLVDNFQYDNYSNPIIPNDNFLWIDINNIQHTMFQRDGMPPLIFIEDTNINYIW
jgi:hypothetical protein